MPSLPGQNGRHANGRFAHGNKLGQGNPLLRKQKRLRIKLLACAKKEHVEEVYQALYEKAKGGDLAAIREFFNRTVGRTALPVELSGNDGEPLQSGPSLGDIQLAAIEGVAHIPGAKEALAKAYKELYERSRSADNGLSS